MPFTHIDKGPGDVIRSADWNEMGREIQRLGGAKLDRDSSEPFAGPLTVQGDVTVGAANKGAGLRVLKKQEDGTSVDHGAVILGTDAAASASLRLGYSGHYSWIQGQGKSTLAINPRGGNVGIGTDAPQDRLEVAGALRVGNGMSPLQIGGAGSFADKATGNAEIFNDTTSHMALVIAGNKSAGAGRRVSVRDDLKVAGSLHVNGRLQVNESVGVNSHLSVQQSVEAGWMRVSGMWVPGAREDYTFFLRGSVNQNGSRLSGAGWDVSKAGTGLYDITFGSAFSQTPAGVVTQVCSFDNADGVPALCDTRISAVITGISSTRMRVMTGNSAGNTVDRNFCFIVMGPRTW